MPTQPVRSPAGAPVLRFMDPARVEIAGAGALATAPVRLNLGARSSLDLGTPGAPQPSAGDGMDEAVQADLIRDASGGGAIAFHPGVLSGFPVVLKPRSPATFQLKVTVPPDAQPGEQIRTDLLQRNARGQVIGGISILARVVAKK